VTCTEGTMADRTTQKPTHYLTSKRCLDDLRTRIREDAATGSERTTILSKLLEQLTAATRAHAEASPQEEQDAPPVVVDAATYVTLFRGYASYRRIAGAALAVLAAALQQVEQQTAAIEEFIAQVERANPAGAANQTPPRKKVSDAYC